MDDEIDAVLADRLGALGAASWPGAGSGARWSARRLRTETAADSDVVEPGRLPTVVDRLVALLEGTVQVDAAGARRVRGTVGSGFGGLNPAYVVAVLEPSGRLAVAAYAKEGLIRQRSAEKAVARVLAEARSVA